MDFDICELCGHELHDGEFCETCTAAGGICAEPEEVEGVTDVNLEHDEEL